MLVIVVDYNGKIQTIMVTVCLELNHQLLYMCITLNSNVDSIHTGHILHGEEMTYTCTSCDQKRSHRVDSVSHSSHHHQTRSFILVRA